MNLTVKNLRRMYRELNTKAFNGELPMIRIKAIHSYNKAWYGLWNANKYEMTLNIAYIEDHGSIKETMLHEMVHIWQFLHNKEMLHNKNFFSILSVVCKKANVAFDYAFHGAAIAAKYKI